MHLLATPTKPDAIAPRSMIDLDDLPEEYATFFGYDQSSSTLYALHKGTLYTSLVMPTDDVRVITYAASNALETQMS